MVLTYAFVSYHLSHIVFDFSCACWIHHNEQIVNFGSDAVNLKVTVDGLDPNSGKLSASTKTVLTSDNVMDENSFDEPKKVVTMVLMFLLLFISCDVVMQYTDLIMYRKAAPCVLV